MVQKQDTYRIFLEDANTEFSMRDYRNKMKCGNTKATRILKEGVEENYLTKNTHRKYSFYTLNKQSLNAKSLTDIYWRNKLQTLTEEIKQNTQAETIIMIGDIPEMNTTPKSSIKLIVFSKKTSTIKLSPYIKKWGRGIKIIKIPKWSNLSISYKPLALNGILLSGKLG